MINQRATVESALTAIESSDFDRIEFLRDEVQPEWIPVLLETWDSSLPWEKKDCYIFLLMDQLDERLIPMMEDGLDSPTVESRAYSLCVLLKDFSTFNKLLDGGWVSAEKVDLAIADYEGKIDN